MLLELITPTFAKLFVDASLRLGLMAAVYFVLLLQSPRKVGFAFAWLIGSRIKPSNLLS